MNAGRAIAVVLLIAGVVAFFLLRHSSIRHDAPPESAGPAGVASRTSSSHAPSLDPATGAATADLAATQQPSAPSRALVASDPEGAARAWHARAASVVAAKDRREYGDEVARLMHLPIAQSWEPLLERAESGDLAAAAAALHIASICSAESTRDKSRDSVTAPPAVSKYFRDLPATWKPFVDRVGAEFREAHAARVDGCADIGNFMDTAMLFFDQFMRPGNADAEIEIAAENENQRTAIGDLRAILANHDTERGRALLGELLMKSEDSAEHAEGVAMLEALAETDTSVATRLGTCLADGCSGLAKDPAAARPWFEQAAGLGEPLAYARLADDLAAHGENAAAWAWSLYWLDLALDGCFETIAPMYFNIASAAEEEALRKAVLSPAEQNAGLAMSYAIAGRWEKKAKERLACAD